MLEEYMKIEAPFIGWYVRKKEPTYAHFWDGIHKQSVCGTYYVEVERWAIDSIKQCEICLRHVKFLTDQGLLT